MASIEDILHESGLQPGLQVSNDDQYEAATNVCYSLLGIGSSTLAYAGWRYRNIWLPLMPSLSSFRYCMACRMCVNTSTTEGNQSVVIEMGIDCNSITGRGISGSPLLIPPPAMFADGSVLTPRVDNANSNAIRISVPNGTTSIDFRNLDID